MSDLRSSFWRRAAGLVEPLSERALQAQITRGEISAARAGERLGNATVPAPGGALVWMHARGIVRGLDLTGVMARLWDDHGEIDLLLTTRADVDDGALARRLPPGVIHQYLPFDRPQAVQRFLAHWSPALCLWSDTPEPSLMLTEIAARGYPTCLLPGDALDAWTARRMRPRLRQFDRVFVTDTAALARVREAGVPAAAAVLSGRPREDAVAPAVKATEREQVARVLEGRPVWLAAGIPIEELEPVLDAHAMALRRNPRLALIVLPEPDAELDAFVARLDAANMPWSHSAALSQGGLPVEVILADRSRGEGLWYHLATVSFIGGSLALHGGQSPLLAAALGSAVLHGPHIGYFSDIFERLATGGAAVQVATAQELGQAVVRCIVPGRAAEMAHAAWRISSDGAQATDCIVAALGDLLDHAGGGGA